MSPPPPKYREVVESGYHNVGWSHVFVQDGPGYIGEVLRWCTQQFPRFNDSNWRWHHHGYYFLFTFDDDAFAFKMRWC